VEAEAEDSTGISKDTTKCTAGVNNDEATHDNFQENFLEEEAGKLMRSIGVGCKYADDEVGEIVERR
jgi:hypothetical protein